MSCDSPDVELESAADVVMEAPVPAPVVEVITSASVVEVVESGDEVVVDGTNADYEIVIETYSKGDRGPQGIQGVRGLRGDRGVPGPEGIRGRDGEQGLRGFRGAMGLGGGQGPSGNPGPPGEIDSELLLELVQPMLNEAALIPIAEIREQIGELPGNILGSFLGDLAGTDVTESDWSAGDDGSHFVGSVTTVSMISDKDYSSYKKTWGMIANVDNGMAAIRQEQYVIAELGRSTASQLTTFIAQTGENVASIQQQLTTTTTLAYATAISMNQLSAMTEESLAQMTERVELLADDLEATTLSLTQYIASTNSSLEGVDQNIALLQETVEVQADAISANASQLLLLSASVGNLGADIQELYELVADAGTGELYANYQLKAQVTDGDRVVMTGIALGAAIGGDDDYRSEIIFMADTVGFMTQNGGAVHQPFVFDVANDTARLNSVFIGDATISYAKIANDLQSTNYAPNFAGWRVDRNGILEANQGNFRGTIRASAFLTGAYTGYNWPPAGPSNVGVYLGPGGFLMGNQNNGRYFQVTQEGDIYAPGFSVVNGTMTINQANVVNTLNIAGNAVSASNFASGNNYAATSLYVPAGVTASVFAIVVKGVGGAATSGVSPATLSLNIHGNVFSTAVWPVNVSTEFWQESAYANTTLTGQVSIAGPASISIVANFAGIGLSNPVSVLAFARFR